MPEPRDIPKLIEIYAAGGDKLRAAVAGLSHEEMTSFPVPGTWSIHQIVVHLQDSDLVGVDRMKRIAAETNPLLVGYNESLFTQNLDYHEQSIDDAITLFDLARKQFARVLRRLSADAFSRTGVHNEVGLVTLGSQLEKYIEHFEHHLRFIEKKRKLLGK